MSYKRKIDLIGKKFKKLTPIEYLGESKYLCKCECGNTKIVLTGDFNRGSVASCGCFKYRKYEDLRNKKFNKLTVINVPPVKVGKCIYWYCICDCGNLNAKLIRANHIKRGDVKSCGCLLHKVTHNKFRYQNNDIIAIKISTDIYTLIDKEDFEKVMKYRWYCANNNYASCSTIKNLLLHRYLLNIIDGDIEIDHINRNRLDNRKSNLRICTRGENARNISKPKNNTSGIIGVGKEKSKWVAKIEYCGDFYTIGRYDNIYDATKARLIAEIEYFKEFAPQIHLFEKFGLLDYYNEIIRSDINADSKRSYN